MSFQEKDFCGIRFISTHTGIRIGVVILAILMNVAFADECTTPTAVQPAKLTTATLSADGIKFLITPVLRIEANGWVVVNPGRVQISVISSQRRLRLANFYQYRVGQPLPALRLRPVRKISQGYSVSVEVLPDDFLHFWAVVFDDKSQCFTTRTLVVRVAGITQ
ncbi:hypothetical protein J7M23_08020 [Candidatus Sumerlaeota bacterium]|nr:hypothetical protein [Candidatus Sumerlaeota bacterium]